MENLLIFGVWGPGRCSLCQLLVPYISGEYVLKHLLNDVYNFFRVYTHCLKAISP